MQGALFMRSIAASADQREMLFRAILRIFSPRANTSALLDGLRALWRNRRLCVELVRRDLGGQYIGQALGTVWVVVHPLMLMCVYIFVFAFVFRVRLGGTVEMPRDYIVYILSGLVPWIAIQSALARSSTSMVSQANLVKQVVFPTEVLPFGSVIISMVPQLVGVSVLALYTIVATRTLPWTYVLLPFYFVLEVLFLSGIAFVLGPITPFFRDIKDFVAVSTVIGVYLVPAVYPPAMLEKFNFIFLCNPLSYPIWLFQDITYYGHIEHPYAWVVTPIMSILSFTLGYRVFAAVKPYVANVL
jgi:lipopolysaccharide transport system permease protein